METELFVLAKKGLGIIFVRPREKRTIFISHESIVALENNEPEAGREKIVDAYALICSLFADALVKESPDNASGSFTSLMSSGFSISNVDFAVCAKIPADIGGILKRSIDPLFGLVELVNETGDVEEFIKFDFVD